MTPVPDPVAADPVRTADDTADADPRRANAAQPRPAASPHVSSPATIASAVDTSRAGDAAARRGGRAAAETNGADARAAASGDAPAPADASHGEAVDTGGRSPRAFAARAAAGSTRRVDRRALLTLGGLRPSEPTADHWIHVFRRAMACRFEITLSGEDARHVAAARDALAEADRLDAALTVFRDTSDLVRLNQAAIHGPAETTPELFALLAQCRDLHARTGGAFDITSTPLSRCWGFLAREGRVPPDEAIAAARACVGMDGVELTPAVAPAPISGTPISGITISDTTRSGATTFRATTAAAAQAAAGTVRFTRPSMELNLGSIGKGYAVQRIADVLRAHGVRHALIAAGASSVVALGGRAADRGHRGWAIDLCSRQRGGAAIARLYLRDGALGTSGAGEQFVTADGRRYGHVLDPRTGWPASGITSASVVHADGAAADALATAFLVGGLALARAYCAAHSDTLALITPDGARRPVQFGAYPGAVVEDP